MRLISKISPILFILSLCVFDANAYEYSNDKYSMKFSGYGNLGVIESESKEEPLVTGDWLVRGQIDYAISADEKIGFVYAIDELAIYQNEHARDAFVFMEDANCGRLELGLTDSVVTKLGVGLPDVSGLRINDNSLLYDKIDPSGPIMSNTTLTSGRYDLRANFVSIPTRPLQYGFSVAGLSPNYDYALDLGLKYRRPAGKTKTAVSFGVSFIDSPENLQTDVYMPRVTADSRIQLSTGINLQYNSWIWGFSGRVIYDENPIGVRADGIVAGTGGSYDLLNYTLSATYLLSSTGVWDDAPNYMAHTQLLSFRYKYSENLDGWMSTGFSAGTPFLSAGLKVKF